MADRKCLETNLLVGAQFQLTGEQTDSVVFRICRCNRPKQLDVALPDAICSAACHTSEWHLTFASWLGFPGSTVLASLPHAKAKVPKRKETHAIADSYTTHKHPKVRQWFARRPRRMFHCTSTSAPGLNTVEGFIAKLSGVGSNAACSAPSPICKPPSTASSRRPTMDSQTFHPDR